ncbi:TnpV protein [Enterococcus hirae]|uniref:TnpV protein n=2 Tax=Enterococcus hirae TaxID=1354 RepID=UPI0019E7E0F3|nr:TnpV protein [Enterococcus hirae]EMF0105682.1 TnpV protein [Enterococcus hirae]EMF0131618.1 TnpV protein [Enterococcus hirae]EMF0150125.1 TnpV protein [Enterococcus hirae]EMF0246181.1 TnpV protein [Enterococcus hirae]
MLRTLDQINHYQEKMNQVNQEYKRRTRPIVNLNYQKKEDGLLYPQISTMRENHKLSQQELMIQEYLQENNPTLYHELFLTGELMIYLKSKRQEMKDKERKIFTELLQEKINQLPKDLIQRTREINQLKEQAHELMMKEILPI